MLVKLFVKVYVTTTMASLTLSTLGQCNIKELCFCLLMYHPMKVLSLLPSCLRENFANVSLYGQSFWMKMLVNGINLLHLPWAIQLWIWLIVCICCCVIQGAKASNANVAVEDIFMRKLCQCKDDLLAGRKKSFDDTDTWQPGSCSWPEREKVND